MLQQVMVRMVKGELGERLLLWRREFEDVRKAEMEAKLVNADAENVEWQEVYGDD